MNLTIRKICMLIGIFFSIIFTIQTQAADMPPNPLEKEGYFLDFADEFDGNTLDSSKWISYYLPHWCQNVNTAKANYRFEDGCLVEYIDKDQKPWCPQLDGDIISSAIMSFDKSWIHNFSGTTMNHDRKTWYGYTTRYGYFEIRAKLADCGGGGHQAWWLVGMQQDTNNWDASTQTGEIDIIENFFTDTSVWRSAAFGWNDSSFSSSWVQQEYSLTSGSLTEEFHIYALEWTPYCLKFYFDNQLVNVIADSPDYEMGAILNIYANTGYEPSNDVWPKEWFIDYYRVWKPIEQSSSSITDKYLIKNRATGDFVYIDPFERYVQCAPLSQIDMDFATWYIEEAENGYVWIQNAATDEYLHVDNQTGYVEHNVYSRLVAATQWKPEPDDEYLRLFNRAYPNQSIHTENELSRLQFGLCKEEWWSGQWTLIPF